MHWCGALVLVACTPSASQHASIRPASALAGSPVALDAALAGTIADAGDGISEPDATAGGGAEEAAEGVDRGPVTAPTFAAKQPPRACPQSPEGIGAWVEELFSGCAPEPFTDVVWLKETPNICDGPCPLPCVIVVGDGTRSKVIYDSGGRWTKTTPLINSSGISSLSCTYDAGRRASCVVDYRRDPQDTPISTTLTAKRDKRGRIVEITDSEDWKEPFRFKYDGAGRVIRATWELDAQHKGVTTYTYDQAGRLASETDWSGKTRYQYNGAGQLVKQVSADASVVYKYENNRIVEESITHGLRRMSGPTKSTLAISYDATGRPHTIGDATFLYECK